MPITARLSRRFYDKFGDDIVNELVEWLNQVDLAFRTELQRTSDVELRRIEAKLDQRFAEFTAEMRGEIGSGRLEMRSEVATVRNKIHALKAELIKWMFLFWAGTQLGSLFLK